MNNYDFRINRICFLEARILNKDVEKWGNLKILIASVLLCLMEYTIFSRIIGPPNANIKNIFLEMTHCGGEDPICNDLGFSSQRQRQNDKQGAKKLQLSSSSVLDKNVYLALIFTSP